MKKHLLIYLFTASFLLPKLSFAQTSAADSLLNAMSSSEDEIALLPDKMPVYKRVFWGEHGLLRKTGIAPLTMENREREMNARRKMLLVHQVSGYVTSALIVATAVSGQKLYDGEWTRSTHRTIESTMGISYLVTGALSLLSPPPLIIRRDKGFSNIKIHRALAVVHGAGMFMNGVLGEDLARQNRSLHRTIGYVTAGSLLGAMVVMKF